MHSSDNQLVYGEMIVVLLSREAAGTKPVGGDRVVYDLGRFGSVCERTQDEEAILLPPDPL